MPRDTSPCAPTTTEARGVASEGTRAKHRVRQSMNRVGRCVSDLSGPGSHPLASTAQNRADSKLIASTRALIPA